jgi:hypothetical protein
MYSKYLNTLLPLPLGVNQLMLWEGGNMKLKEKRIRGKYERKGRKKKDEI